MKTPRIITALLALAGTVFFAQPAQATLLTFNTGDLILGFRASGGTGASTDYEVNLGSAASFLSGGNLTLFSGGGLGADLTTLYGAGWNSRSDVFWSISGATQGAAVGAIPSRTLFATSASSTPWDAASAGAQATPAGLIVSLGSGVQGYNKGDTVPSPNNGTLSLNVTGGLFQPTTAGNSYRSYMPGGANDSTSGAAAFNYFTGGIEGNFGSGTAGSSLNLFEMTTANSGNAGTLVGSFQLNDSGVVSFSAAAVPEPSTYAAILGAVTLGFVALRRRQQGKA